MNLAQLYDQVVKGIHCPFCGAWPWSPCYALRTDWHELPVPHRARVRLYRQETTLNERS